MSALWDRLTRQLAARGVTGARSMAARLLKKRGQMNEDGTLTAKGKQRQMLGNGGRAKDRAAKRSGRSRHEYDYNPKTNRATLKK